MRWLLILLAALSLSGVAGAKGNRFPHFAYDLAAGNTKHLSRHLASQVKIETYSYGKLVDVSPQDLVNRFKGCKLIRYGDSDFMERMDNAVLTLNCGDRIDMTVNTFGKTNDINHILFHANAVALPAPPGNPLGGMK